MRVQGKIPCTMFKYAVCEIAGRQYKITPDQELVVDHLGDEKLLECDKVLLLSEESGLKVGTPFLGTKLSFDILESKRLAKIRVAKFHAKANYRKVIGSRRHVSKIKLSQRAVKTRY